MDNKGGQWQWQESSSRKSPGDARGSSSTSSHSAVSSNGQDSSLLRLEHARSPEISSKPSADVVNEKCLAEKLAAALSNIKAKEDLVKQHAKVAEEAILGWEKAEKEASSLRQKLEALTQKNSALHDQITHLDNALKECVRQLSQAREEQERKIQEALTEKTSKFEASKTQLENQLTVLQSQLENAKLKTSPSTSDFTLQSKLETIEKENGALKLELSNQSIELKNSILERDLSTQTAETASKQLLDSIKKVAKLEAECRRLQTMSRKSSHVGADHRSVSSVSDSHSENGERLYQVETEIQKLVPAGIKDYDPNCSDSWASALIAELDQFKINKSSNQTQLAISGEDNLMNDFLEMERLAALSEAKSGSPRSEIVTATDIVDSRNGSPARLDLQNMVQRISDMEKELQMTTEQKTELDKVLSENQKQLELSKQLLAEANEKLEELQREVDMAKEAKLADEVEIETMNARKKMVELQLEAAFAEIRDLKGQVVSLEIEVEQERALSLEIKARCQNLEKEIEREKAMSAKMNDKYQNLRVEIEQERATSAELKVKCQNLTDELAKKNREVELHCAAIGNGEVKIKQDKELAMAAGKLEECQKTIASLGQQLKSLASLEDFLLDPQMAELNAGSLVSRDGEMNGPASDVTNGELVVVSGTGTTQNGKQKSSPPSSSSSSSSSSGGGTGEKSRNGFGKLFSRSRGKSSRVENQ